MKKLNNNGFAITSILYSIMVLFLMLLLSILGILGSRKAILDKNKKDILENLNNEVLNNKFNFEHRNITIINSGNTDDIVYALMDGVTAIDENGNQISSENISYNLDVNDIENETYTVTYTANNNGKIIIGTRKITFTDNDIVNTFIYTGSEQEFIPSYNGSYKIELWGARGGNMTGEGVDYQGNSRGQFTYYGGKASYTGGRIKFTEGQSLYVYVGGAGGDNEYKVGGNEIGGYNGGGSLVAGQGSYGAPGGGATDIRIENGIWSNFESLKSRIMVAAGGGGANFRNQGYGEGNGGSGGTIEGINGEEALTEGSYHRLDYDNGYFIGLGGKQTIGGDRIQYKLDGSTMQYTDTISGSFGGNFSTAQSGAGSGYYAGGSSSHGGAGGGSSFISGYDGCDAIAEESTSDNIIHTGQSIHYSGYKFDNAVMYAGNESMPTHDGTGTMIGNNGDGYAKISLIYYY